MYRFAGRGRPATPGRILERSGKPSRRRLARPLFRLDNGRLDDLTDRVYCGVRQSQNIADWRGETITYRPARGAVMTRGGDEAG